MKVSPQLYASGDCSPRAIDPVWAGDVECILNSRGDGVVVICTNDGWEERTIGHTGYVGHVGYIGYIGYIGHIGCVGHVGHVGYVGHMDM